MTDFELRYANLPSISGGENGPDDQSLDPPAPPAPPAPTTPRKLSFDAETQEHINALLADERKKAEDRTRKAVEAEQAEKAKKDASEREANIRKALKEQGDLTTLNQKLTDDNARLTAENERLTTELADYESAIEEEYAAFLEAAPAAALVFKPSDDASPSVKRKFMEQAHQMLDQIEAPYGPAGGLGPSPRPAGPLGDDDPEAKDARIQARARRYTKRF